MKMEETPKVQWVVATCLSQEDVSEVVGPFDSKAAAEKWAEQNHPGRDDDKNGKLFETGWSDVHPVTAPENAKVTADALKEEEAAE